MEPPFRDRSHAGALLAGALTDYAGRPDVVVVALPRGGVPVGYELAARLDVPLDVLVVRKLGVPGHEELAMGAIASGGVRVTDPHIIEMLRVDARALAAVIARETAELERREQLFRGMRPALALTGKTVLLVDDGLATGSTMLAAIEALRALRPAAIVGAVPVAPPETCRALRARVEEMVCLVTPSQLGGVGLWYEDFRQTSDAEVRTLLLQAEQLERRRAGPHAPEVHASRTP